MQLPLDHAVPSILSSLAAHPRLIVTAAPGAGKTTRLPPALLPAVTGAVWVLEPRRVAARAAARRVAEERGSPVGGEVGWQVRLERAAGPSTRLLYMTVGVFIRKIQEDPFLTGVGAVVIDELHERSLEMDLALALLRAVQREVRPDLWLVAMSATLDSESLSGWLEAKVISVPGTLYPVTLEWDPYPDARPLPTRVAEAVIDLSARIQGRILVFLPGLYEINQVTRLLPGALGVERLHGSDPLEEAARVIEGTRGGRVVLATNVAETSVTVAGVAAVVDAGAVRQLRHHLPTGLDRLELRPISRASATQRAGRAGRLGPGIARRLWTAAAHAERPEYELPEISRSDLSGVAITLLSWGERDLQAFGWVQAPPPDALAHALDSLEQLGLTRDGALTTLGRQAAALPASPRLARFLLAAHATGALRAAIELALTLDSRAGSAVTGGGLSAEQRREAEHLERAVRKLLGPEGRGGGAEGLARAALAAWPDRVARLREGGVGRLVGGRGVRLPGETAPGWICALDVEGSGSAATVRAYLPLREEWLPTEEGTELREEDGVIRAFRQRRYRDLVITEHPARLPEDGTVEAALVGLLRAEGPAKLGLDRPEISAFLARVALLAAGQPRLGLPTLSATLEEHHEALVLGARSVAEVRAQLLERLEGLLTWPQREALAREVPEKIQVPSGSWRSITYALGEPPVLEVRMQELFGLSQTLRVAGRPLRLHLLAPNGRPQQITEDLAGFWKNTWPDVRKELRGRYPRHAWPEDPASAAPLRGVKPRGT